MLYCLNLDKGNPRVGRKAMGLIQTARLPRTSTREGCHERSAKSYLAMGGLNYQLIAFNRKLV